MRNRLSGQAPMNVTMNPTINVTEVSGSPEAIAQRISLAMERPARIERPTRIVLDEIKRARLSEQRLGYV